MIAINEKVILKIFFTLLAYMHLEYSKFTETSLFSYQHYITKCKVTNGCYASLLQAVLTVIKVDGARGVSSRVHKQQFCISQAMKQIFTF